MVAFSPDLLEKRLIDNFSGVPDTPLLGLTSSKFAAI